MMEVVYTFCTSIFDRIFGYLEYILLNGSGHSVPLSATTTVLSMTEIESTEKIQIDKNDTCRKMQNNIYSPGINNRLKQKETLQKKINFEFGNTEPSCYYNNIETLKTAINSSGLYYGIFYENMVGYCTIVALKSYR